jgi:hypothetical protein
MNKIAKDQAAIEQIKLIYSMIHKENDNMSRNISDIKANASKMLLTQQLELIQNGISAQSQILQELY